MLGMTAKPLEALKRRGSTLVRKYTETEDPRKRTEVVRELATVLVDMREHFITPDGEPDWAGRTYGYRDAVHSVYSGSGVPRSDTSSLQAATRYHVGNVIRARLSPDELESAGLQEATPIARSKAQRKGRQEEIAVLRGSSADPLSTAQMVETLLRRVRPSMLTALTTGQRADLDDLLAEVEHQAKRLRKAALSMESTSTLKA